MALENAIHALMGTLRPPPEVLAGAVGAWGVGVTGSLHCLLMCGPLACASLPGVPGAERMRAVAAYQLSRVAAYASVGGLLGLLGGGVTHALTVSAAPYLPWVMAAALVASALEVGKHLRPWPGLARLASRMARAAARFSWPVRASAMGAVTPLLPCGLLYGVFAAALATGSVLGGALVGGLFAVGGLPALLGAQLHLGLWKKRPRLAAFMLQRAAPLLAAGVLVYRALGTATGQPPHCH